jgi:hypothetical protein
MAETARTVELRAVAQAIADALPETVEEVVVTGSVSRGVADEVSDIEMLLVTRGELELEECFALAGDAGLIGLDTWGQQGVPTKRVSGYLEGVPIELVWWPGAYAEEMVDAIFAGNLGGTADALANGVALRTSGLLAQWQERLQDYPDELAQGQIEDAALTWGGFTPAGLLTIIRPGERLSFLERMVDDAIRVTRIVFALNRVWQPTTKRLAARVEPLAVKPERLAERIEEALTEPDLRRGVIVMTELQLETAELAPDGPNIIRARQWLSDALEILNAGRTRA